MTIPLPDGSYALMTTAINMHCAVKIAGLLAGTALPTQRYARTYNSQPIIIDS